MAAAIIAAAAAAGIGIYKVAHGAHQRNLAKKARANLHAPFYQVQDEYYQNDNTANSMAQGGLPAATKDYYTNASERGLSAGIKGILGSGGNPNDVSKIFQTYNDSLGKVSSADAEQHLENIKYYMNVNKDLAGQKTIQWAINQQQPYLNTLKELTAAKTGADAEFNSGLTDIASAAVSYGTSRSNANLMPSGTKTSTGSASNYARLFANNNSGIDTSGSNTNAYKPPPDPFGSQQASGGGSEQDYQDYLNWKQQNGKI